MGTRNKFYEQERGRVAEGEKDEGVKVDLNGGEREEDTTGGVTNRE